jgi:nucleoside-diphosphate-sugar epimerase
MDNIKILILGSNGFIGKNCKYLLKHYNFYYVERKDIDIMDKSKLNIIFENFYPDTVINCCGVVGSSVSNKEKDQFSILNNNLILNINILECCKQYCVKKIILFSTYRLFSNDIVENYTEEHLIHNFDIINDNTGYLLSKQIMDIQVKLLKNNLNITTLILPNIFGNYDSFYPDSRIVPSIIVKMNNAKKLNTDLHINSNENVQVNIVYINDIINIINKCIQEDNINGNIIVFNKNNILTLKELSLHIKEVTNFKKDIIFNNDLKYTTNNIMTPDISKFNNLFKDFIFTDLKYSLKETITNYLNLLEETSN